VMDESTTAAGAQGGPGGRSLAIVDVVTDIEAESPWGA